MGTNIEKAIDILQNGGAVGIPTETVYGLAASIESNAGLHKIFEIKERPFFDPLIVHINHIDQAKKYTKNWNKVSDILAKAFWPGPLTMVLEKSDQIDDLITAGLNSVGIRMPEHKMALDLIKHLGHPVAAPSANKFTKTSPTSYEHVKESFPELLVLDGGPCTIGIESTVIGIFEDKVAIYRPGMISESDIRKALEDNASDIIVEQIQSPVAPGQLKHHYMPKIPVILVKGDIQTDYNEVDKVLMENPAYMELNPSAAIAARNLYQNLRDFDQKHSSIIVNVTESQLDDDKWEGIIDRLDKASSIIILDTLSK
jgi:L-threonylcarbamoyladenylate synthase